MNHPIRGKALEYLAHAFPARRSTPGKSAAVFAAHLAAWLALAGCAVDDVSYKPMILDEKPLPPNHVLVYDFTATKADISSDAPVGARLSSAGSLSPEQIALDRRVGSNMAAQVVAAVREMGLPAERALPGANLQFGDLVIRGYLASVDEKSGAPRFTIGFDPGAPEMAAVVESFQITSQGWARKLNLGASTAAGNATPEDAAPTNTVPVSAAAPGYIVTSRMKIDGEASYRNKVENWAQQSVKEIVDRLKTAFQEQGWVN